MSTELPLLGLTVVEIGGGVAASYCTKLMADLGADVIKVEDPDDPDPVRTLSPRVVSDEGEGVSGSFMYLNTSKRSLGLDLGSDAGMQTLESVIARADLVVESLAHANFVRLGMDAVLDRAVTRGVVAMSVSDFGRSGPYSAFIGSSIVLDAMSGWIYGLGDADREPRRSPGYHSMVMTGVYAYIAGIAGVYRVREGADAARVDLSAMESVLWAQLNITTTFEYSGHVWKRHGSRSPMSHPQGVYECKDGLIGVNVLYYAEWDRFPAFIGHPELLDDPRFTTPLDRANNAAALDEIMRPWLMAHGRLELYRMAQEHKLPFALVNSPADLVNSDQLRARQFWVEVEHPSIGAITMPSSPFRMGETRWGPRWPAPALGQHNDEILGGQ